MALATFANLKASIADWLHRDDLTANIPDLITLAEARHARDLRLRQMQTTSTLTATAAVQSITLPTRWLQFTRLRLVAPAKEIEYLAPAQWQAAYRASDRGSPSHYTIEGSDIELGPTPDSAYSIDATYYASPVPLSDAAPTNWLLTTHPGLYLWASLAEAGAFIADDPRVPMWETKYRADLEAARDADRKTQGGGGMRIRAR